MEAIKKSILHRIWRHKANHLKRCVWRGVTGHIYVMLLLINVLKVKFLMASLLCTIEWVFLCNESSNAFWHLAFKYLRPPKYFTIWHILLHVKTHPTALLACLAVHLTLATTNTLWPLNTIMTWKILIHVTWVFKNGCCRILNPPHLELYINYD